jgi:hypothetical protein
MESRGAIHTSRALFPLPALVRQIAELFARGCNRVSNAATAAMASASLTPVRDAVWLPGASGTPAKRSAAYIPRWG